MKKRQLEKEKNLIPILEDGNIIYIDEKTGQVADNNINNTKLFDKYNPKKAKMFLTLFSQGIDREEALDTLGISRHTFLYWQKTEPVFLTSLDEARTIRAFDVHDTFYEKEVKPLSQINIAQLSPDEAKEYLHNLKAVEKKQTILSKYKQEESPRRYHTSSAHLTGSISQDIEFKVSVPDDIMKKVKGTFTPTVASDGDIVLQRNEYEVTE